MGRMRACAVLVVLLLAPGAALAADGTTTRRVSVSSEGTSGNLASDTCDVATGGTAVAFGSYATNLVPDDTNGKPDVFAWDQSGAVQRVSVTSTGLQSLTFTEWPTISDDGRFVAFSASGRRLRSERKDHNWMSVFVHDRVTGSTTRVSGPPDGGRVRGNASEGSISGSGRFVAFVSDAPNLTVKRDRNDASDVFARPARRTA